MIPFDKISVKQFYMEQYTGVIQNLINRLSGSPEIEEIKQFNIMQNKMFLIFGLPFFLFSFLLAGYYTVNSNTDYKSVFFESLIPYIGIAMAVSAVVFVGWMIKSNTKSKMYIEKYKRMVVENLVRAVDERFRYEPLEKISEEDFNLAHLFYTYQNRFKGDDLFAASIDGVQVSFSDLRVSKKTSGKKRKKVRIFTGQFYMFDLGKNLTQGNVYFVRDKQGMIANSLGKFFSKVGIKDRGEIIAIPDPELEAEFRLIAEVKEEGGMMYQKLLPIINFLRNNFSEWNFAFSIVGGKLYLAIHDRAFRFESPHHKKLLDPETFEKYIEDFSSSVRVVDGVASLIKQW